MSAEMNIDEALAQLEAGKFSFRMVDAVKGHIGRLESELDVVRALHASAVRDVKLQEYANWRLEREVARTNAKIHALVRANILMEKAEREIAPRAAALAHYGAASLEVGRSALERAAADYKSGKLQARAAESFSQLREWLDTLAPSPETIGEWRAQGQKALQRLQPLVARLVAQLMAQAAAATEKASAYLSQLRKTSA
jgi:hypothetical protein